MPVVVSQVWYHVGSMDEPVGKSGISHMLEHLMFKGTKKFKAGEFSKMIHDLGGSENAATSNDYTYYWELLPAPYLDKAFMLEADRMANLQFSLESFRKEREVVMEERRMRFEDVPSSLAYEQFFVAAHIGGPYRHMAIGWKNDIAQYTLEDAVDWYQRYYAPNNATVVVVGDVHPSEVYHLAKRYFGRVGARPVPEGKQYDLPKAAVGRSIKVALPAKLPEYWLGVTVPGYRASKGQLKDAYALEVLASVLDGASGTLAAELIRKQQIAVSADAWSGGAERGDSLFQIHAIPAQGHSVSELKMAIFALVTKLQQEPISDETLARVKAQMIAERVYQKDFVQAQATEMGALETVGLGYQFSETWLARIKQVTAAQVQDVAVRYLRQDKATEAELVPLPMFGQNASAAQTGGGDVH